MINKKLTAAVDVDSHKLMLILKFYFSILITIVLALLFFIKHIV